MSMDQFFCFGKKDFCDNQTACKTCQFSDGEGGIYLEDLNKILVAFFGKGYEADHLRELVEVDKEERCEEHCNHVFAYDELNSMFFCQKCGYVLTAEDKRRICNKGLELLESEEREAADHVLKGEKNDRNWT